MGKIKEAILLTGNAGYIGTVMTKFLKDESYLVVGLDSDWFSEFSFFSPPKEMKPDRQIIKDIREMTEDDLNGIDIVIHLAGLSNDPLGEIDLHLTDEINHRATIKIARMCKAKGIKRFIFASSCSIYGIADSAVPINENGRISPVTAYAKAKADAERGLVELADEDFHPVLMRNATVYGPSPRLRLDLVVNNLIAWAYLTGEITIMSDGTPWRPVVHIEDFCNAFIAAIKAPAEKIHSKAFNVGIDEENFQIKEIAYQIQKVLPRSKIRILNERGSDERTYRVDFSKIKEILEDFRPRRRLGEGVTELLEVYRKYNLTLEDFKSGKFFRINSVRSLLGSGKIDEELMRR